MLSAPLASELDCAEATEMGKLIWIRAAALPAGAPAAGVAPPASPVVGVRECSRASSEVACGAPSRTGKLEDVYVRDDVSDTDLPVQAPASQPRARRAVPPWAAHMQAVCTGVHAWRRAARSCRPPLAARAQSPFPYLPGCRWAASNPPSCCRRASGTIACTWAQHEFALGAARERRAVRTPGTGRGSTRARLRPPAGAARPRNRPSAQARAGDERGAWRACIASVPRGFEGLVWGRPCPVHKDPPTLITTCLQKYKSSNFQISN